MNLSHWRDPSYQTFRNYCREELMMLAISNEGEMSIQSLHGSSDLRNCQIPSRPLSQDPTHIVTLNAVEAICVAFSADHHDGAKLTIFEKWGRGRKTSIRLPDGAKVTALGTWKIVGGFSFSSFTSLRPTVFTPCFVTCRSGLQCNNTSKETLINIYNG